MPVLDGFAAVSRIRGMKLAMQPVIIALTALALPGDRERCLAAGMDGMRHFGKYCSLCDN